jgi:hypothetical protein
MSAPKSDNATIESRRAILLELLAEGKNQVQAGEILQGEGYPADPTTIWRDVKSFDLARMNANSSDMDFYRSEQLIELQSLRAGLVSPLIDSKDKIDLALKILDREILILGTEAPRKSLNVNANIDGKLTPEYIEIVGLMANIDESDRCKVVAYIKSLVKPVVIGRECEPPEEKKMIEGEL